jgi:hypothetical protein
MKCEIIFTIGFGGDDEEYDVNYQIIRPSSLDWDLQVENNIDGVEE